MLGYLSIRKDTRPADIVLGPAGLRGLIVSLSVGVIAGCLAASVKLHLGLPGHKALVWMTPVIVARLLGRCRVGTTAGAFTAAFVSLGSGGNIAGGLLGLPLVGAAGALVDACILKLENRRASAPATIIVVALAAMMANLVCCVKRLLGPTGLAPHDFFGSAGLLLRPLSYAFFGFVAGLVAAITSRVVRRRKTRGSQG
ncbi:MAG: hypothetical protein ACYS14_05930 [Planctomycetota bacterium]|jgi:hypothetical protein